MRLVALADGAEENWRYFDCGGPRWEGAWKIVDNGHACEHLRDALGAFYGKDNVQGRAEYERLRVILRDAEGGVDTVITELKGLERKLKRNANKGEGLNNKMQVTSRKSYGFRTFNATRVVLFHALGDLPEPERTHRCC